MAVKSKPYKYTWAGQASTGAARLPGLFYFVFGVLSANLCAGHQRRLIVSSVNNNVN